MDVFVRMQVSVAYEKIENNDGNVGFEITARQFRHHFFDGPKEKTFRLTVRVDRNEIQR